jgi:glycosyltransferase involved in cell wall biosynthesis
MDKTDARRRLGLSEEGPWIVHSGHIYPGRGAEELVEAAVLLPGFQVLFVGGKPPDIERVRSRVERLGLADRIRFAGTVPHRDVPMYLWAADILVMPYTSRTPTFRSMSPLKMFEYLAAGRPILATDFPVIREILNSDNAALVPPDSAEALAEGIRALLADQDRRERLAAQACRDAGAYAWEARARGILKILLAKV